MSLTLTSAQQRVLGVMIEKSLTHPGSYPLTLNAIQLGCNQKSNREPLVEYSEGDVGRVLHELKNLNLVALAPTAPGARSNRFQHRVEQQLNWGRQWQAVMAELLLRGPQTAGELRGRASRMVPLPSIELLTTILDELAAHDPPYVRAMPREPGRSAVRFMHLLYSEGEAPVPRAPVPAAAPAWNAGLSTSSGAPSSDVFSPGGPSTSFPSASVPSAVVPSAGMPPAEAPAAGAVEFSERLAALEAQVAQMRAELDDIRGILERPTGG